VGRADLQQVVLGLLFHVGQQERQDAQPKRALAGGQVAVGGLEVVRGLQDLVQVVLALRAVGRLTHLLHGRQEEANEDGDDRNHHQQLDQGEGDRSQTSSEHGSFPQKKKKNAEVNRKVQVLRFPTPDSAFALGTGPLNFFLQTSTESPFREPETVIRER